MAFGPVPSSGRFDDGNIARCPLFSEFGDGFSREGHMTAVEIFDPIPARTCYRCGCSEADEESPYINRDGICELCSEDLEQAFEGPLA